ncbi:MAG: EF-P lysine aminoacylase GenX [Kiritimatiellaeota bacterium]|nr:EF-P lysine aminoacylase GenX [Kiritimatiellota bacterium]
MRKTDINEAAAAVRDFFRAKGFNEVATPIIAPAPIPEPTIEAFRAGNGFLRTSPEPQMKTLLANGAERIFQIGSCFRKNEKGRLHREEFTMLEWYEKDAEYLNLVPFARALLVFVAENTIGTTEISVAGTIVDLDSDWTVMTVAEAFAEFAAIDIETAVAEDRFEDVLVEEIEPALPRETPVILKDYPAKSAALAKIADGVPPTAERWELYIGGVELANTYTELTDFDEHKRRFARFAAERAELGMTDYPEDRVFMDALCSGLPDCAGCALGMDRLVMLLNGDDRII